MSQSQPEDLTHEQIAGKKNNHKKPLSIQMVFTTEYGFDQQRLIWYVCRLRDMVCSCIYNWFVLRVIGGGEHELLRK